MPPTHSVRSWISRTGSLRPWLLVGMLTCPLGCNGQGTVAEPTLDEQGKAIVGGMDRLLEMGACDDQGRYWISEGAVYTGFGLGSAGIGIGLLAGASELERLPISDATRTQSGEIYFSEALATAAWLKNRARVTGAGDVYQVSWPACDDGRGTLPQPPEGWSTLGLEPSACEEPAEARPACSDSMARTFVGLEYGVSGIGLFFLELYDQLYFSTSPDELRDHLQYAVGAGDWLLAQAALEPGGAHWPDSVATISESTASELAPYETSPAYTSLARGTAGVGFFLLRLSLLPGDGDRFLEGARAAGDWLISMESAAGGEGSPWVPVSAGGSKVAYGLLDGNAGVAYFLLALYEQTGDLCYAQAAQRILTGLEGLAREEETIAGLSWPAAGDEASDEASNESYTNLREGAAGIGWVFLQAARTLDPDVLSGAVEISSSALSGQFDVLDSAYLSLAESAADWLASAHIGHFYEGSVWWPELLASWSEYAPWSNQVWPEDESLTTGMRTFTHYPGITRGTAGIGWFMEALGQHSEDGCYAEVGDQGARWLYYYGKTASTGQIDWVWPRWIVRTLTLAEGGVAPGADHYLGNAGVIGYLAHNRMLDDVPTWPSEIGFLGLKRLAPPSTAAVGCVSGSFESRSGT